VMIMKIIPCKVFIGIPLKMADNFFCFPIRFKVMEVTQNSYPTALCLFPLCLLEYYGK